MRRPTSATPGLDPGVLHRVLRHGEVADCKPLPWGSNYTFAALLRKRGAPPALTIYKPRRGESPLWDFPGGTLYRREYAAWIFSRALGWNFVPPTVVRHGPYGIGSMQLYIDPDPSADYRDFVRRFPDQMQRIAVFDAVTNNADRKASHCILDQEGRLWGIDHGLCFNDEPKLRTVIWDFRGQAIPEGILNELRAICPGTPAGSALAAHLRAWLAPREVALTFARLEAIIASGTFPQPGPYRAVPWPPY